MPQLLDSFYLSYQIYVCVCHVNPPPLAYISQCYFYDFTCLKNIISNLVIYHLMLMYIIVNGDLVVPSHRTDWGLRAFTVGGPGCWN